MTDHAPWPHPAALDIETLSRQCVFTKGRMSGPGGQHRNKVETAVFITHTPTGIQAHAGERRESTVNRSVAVTRLRLALAVEVRTPVPVGPIGSALWRSRLSARRDAEGRTTTRIACSPTHHDYPALLAEALDVIADAGWDHSKAAVRLDTTPSQVLKFVKDHSPAYARLNQEREKRKMPKLK